jgi:hypothetical protein
MIESMEQPVQAQIHRLLSYLGDLAAVEQQVVMQDIFECCRQRNPILPQGREDSDDNLDQDPVLLAIEAQGSQEPLSSNIRRIPGKKRRRDSSPGMARRHKRIRGTTSSSGDSAELGDDRDTQPEFEAKDWAKMMKLVRFFILVGSYIY